MTVAVEKKISGWIAEIPCRQDLRDLVIDRKVKDREEVDMTLSALPCILCVPRCHSPTGRRQSGVNKFSLEYVESKISVRNPSKDVEKQMDIQLRSSEEKVLLCTTMAP